MKNKTCAHHSWKDIEVQNLFNFISNGKKAGKKLLSLFDEYAKLYKRKRNSVRNYYYAEIAFLKENEAKRKRLGISLYDHEIASQEEFSKEEEKRLIYDIVKLFSLGHSIRKACWKLANGELSKMIRLQNKYRNILLKEPTKIEDACKKLQEEGFVVTSPLRKKEATNNIVFMPQKKQKIDSKDIQSLFLGLVSLVKKCALEEAETRFLGEINFANDSLRKALVRMTSKDMKIKTLTSDNKVLLQENQKLHAKLNLMRCEIAKSVDMSVKPTHKIKNLKKFVKDITQKERVLEKNHVKAQLL